MRQLACLLLLIGWPAVALAQGEPERVNMHYQIAVKQGHTTAFEKAFREHVEWRRAEGDPWDWRTYVAAVSSELSSYIVRSEGHTWAEFDAYDFQAAKGLAHFEATVMPHVNSVRNLIDRLDAELTHMPEEGAMPTVYTLVHDKLKQGMAQQWRDAVRKISQAVAQEDYGNHMIFWLVSGGSVPQTAIVFPYADWGAIDDPAEERTLVDVLEKVYGAKQAEEIMRKAQSAVEKSWSEMYVYRPDLSLTRE